MPTPGQSRPPPPPQPPCEHSESQNFNYTRIFIMLAPAFLWCILIGFIIRPVYDSGSLDVYYPSARERIRHEWESECNHARQAWKTEQEEHEVARTRLDAEWDAREEERQIHIRHKWELERNHTQKARQAEQASWRIEQEEREVTRARLDAELDRENERHERIRRQWDSERNRTHQEWDLERAAWEEELRSHDVIRARIAAERARLDSEWEAYEEQKRRDAQQKREEDQKRRAGLYWSEPSLHPHDHCLGYRKREYSARLEGMDKGYVGDRMKDCEVTAVEIHGVRMDSPAWCEDLGACNGVWGHWIFEQDDMCAPYWDGLQDLGCTGSNSGIHRYQARLMDILTGSDWHEMCMSTPNRLQGQYLPRPNNCDNHGSHGVWGIWFIPDAACY